MRFVGALIIAAGLCLWSSPVVLADSTTSANWSGYVAHGSGARFRTVSAQWRVPAASCNSGSTGYSSMWLGLGGFSKTSGALEQTGTETDCTRSGRAVYSAWFELVPSPPHAIDLGVRPGDLISAQVSATGHRVSFLLSDLGNHRTFRYSVRAAQVDTTSADWILEAPSECDGSGQCITLPLADFGQAGFSSARARTAGGHIGSLASRWWRVTKLTLVPQGSRFFAGTANAVAEAIPSSLVSGGSVFAVSYRQVSQPVGSAPGSVSSASTARLAAGHLIRTRR